MIKLTNILREYKITPSIPARLIIRHYDISSLELENEEIIEYPSRREAEEAAVRYYWRIDWENMNTDLDEDEFVRQTTFQFIRDNPYENYEFEIEESPLDEIKIKKPGIPDLSDWNQNDIDGDPLVFDSLQQSGTIYAYRLSDTDEYQLDGYYGDGKSMVKQIAEFFEVPIKVENSVFATITAIISTSQFKDLMKKAGVELNDTFDDNLDEIKIKNPIPFDLTHWSYNDREGDPIIFDAYGGRVIAVRDGNNYEITGHGPDGENMIKYMADEFNIEVMPIPRHDYILQLRIIVPKNQFAQLLKKWEYIDNPEEFNNLRDDLDEIKIKDPQVDAMDLDVEDLIREQINKEIDKLAIKEIKFNNKYFLDYLLNQTAYNNAYSVVARFIKLHMIANNHEILKNGQDMLVSLSNAKLVNKADMIDYINENIDLKRYLEKITWRYYIKNVNEKRDDIVDNIVDKFIEYVDDPLEYINVNNIKEYTAFLLDGLIGDYFDESGLGYPEEIFNTSEFEEYLRQTLEQSEMLGENKMIKLLPLLKEYSDKTINDTIARWGIDPTDQRAVNDAKAAIQRFDQIKSALSQRLDIAIIPDEIKNKDYKNIDLYSYEDLLNLLRSLPESDEKIKKEAVRRFVEESGFDKNAIQSTVARFMTKKAALKLAVKDGLEDAGYSAEEIQGFIPKRLFKDDKYLDPRYWKWDEFERMMDTLFPSQMKVSTDEEENAVETDADKVYDSGGLEIYKADDYHKCIKYNPVLSSGVQKYSWCVTKPGSGQGYYQGYRFGEQSPTFYFVVDRDIPSTPNHARFDNKWHAFVVQVFADGNTYKVTSANNGDDTYMKSWDEVGTNPVGGQAMDPAVWNKLKGLKQYFKPVALSPVERAQKLAQGKNLTVDEFKELPQDEKIDYVIGKASESKLKGDILSLLPKYKIPYQGRTVTLANIAIDAGQRFTYNDLKEHEALAKRYAIFRFKHTDYGNEPIPLPFVQYLDDASKYKYYKTFDDNLTFDLIDKFFGNKIAKEYIDEQISKLSYLPATAIKYMSPEQKTLYNLYSKLYTNWKERISDEATIESSNIMPQQEVDPEYITVEEWQNLSTSDKQAIINLAKKYNGNNDYKVLLYALPYMVENNGKTYILLPVDGFKKWVMLDETGRVVEDNIEGRTSFLKNTRLSNGYPTDGNLYRVYNADEVKINGNPLALKESIVRRWQQLAGITEIKISNPAVEQMFMDFIDDNYKKFRNISAFEVEEYDINDFEEPANNIISYLKSLPFERLEYRGITIYWSDMYHTLCIENTGAEPDNITEIKINNPAHVYYLQDWVKPWIDQDYDDIRYEFSEDIADAMYMFREMQEDENRDYITDEEVDNWVEKDEGMWDGDKESILQFLLSYNVIETPESINEIRVSNPAVEQMLMDFIDDNYKEFRNLSQSEVAEYGISEFEESADDIRNYFKSQPNERLDYRGIAIYWSDLYNIIGVENMEAEPDDLGWYYEPDYA